MADERFASEAAGSSHWPTELRLNRAERLLSVRFDDGSHFDLPAEFLRVESPSAEVQGHTPAQKQLVQGKRLVGITRIDPVGNYAVRLTFDDGHDSGIYSWTLLHRLGRDHETLWQAYLAALAARGLGRG
ncbi:gamma-butyrobetaine hydroxylase-like domain-containing protein [Niveispirillum sp.]|uniref:gamma-butyrobetaine hydroxylase-like domain-containing protein n=1 Tax=Niveispirillum sp. TaxID=1917217 RepID=UPI003BAB9EF2